MILRKLCVLFLLARTLFSSDTKSNYRDDSNKLREWCFSPLPKVQANVFNRLLSLAVVGKQKECCSKMNHNSGDQNKSKAQSKMSDTSEGREMQFWPEKLREFPCGQ